MAKSGDRHGRRIRITPLISIASAVLGATSLAGCMDLIPSLAGNPLLTCGGLAGALGLIALVRARMHRHHLAWTLLSLVGIAASVGVFLTKVME